MRNKHYRHRKLVMSKTHSDTKFDSTIFYINQKNWSTIIFCSNTMIIMMDLRTMIFTGITSLVFIWNLRLIIFIIFCQWELGWNFHHVFPSWKPFRSVVIRSYRNKCAIAEKKTNWAIDLFTSEYIQYEFFVILFLHG